MKKKTGKHLAVSEKITYFVRIIITNYVSLSRRNKKQSNIKIH